MKSKSVKKIQIRSKISKRPVSTHDDYFLDNQIKMILTNIKKFQPNLRDEYSGNTALIIATRKKDLKKIKLLFG